PYLYTTWIPCRRDGGQTLVCDANVRRREGLVLERFTYPLAGNMAERGVLHFREGDRSTERPPDALVVSGTDGINDLTGTTSGGGEWGVLVDSIGSRAM